ncbi:MOSC domain-containing protein [Marinobacter goseongensis]|uniref:MOSC domain-containing protein n=1 Tax=Marinobacter goseongensis TaxID=453838 RepID=UPI002005E0B2|nr:MOSC domain-containing protein [Marinobacter goseongensis]
MRVHALYLYPVKSLAGIPVSSFGLDNFGPRGDRRWMIVDADDQFVTQRDHPELATVTTSIDGDCVTVTIPGEGRFPLQATANETRARIWQDWVKALLGEPVASAALSRFCGTDLRFVYMPDETFRRVDAGRVTDIRRVGFADGFPLLVANLLSLEELNTRLETPVEMIRFRPNIVIEGAGAWQEDHWHELQIADQRVRLVKPCSRCVMTTVDPLTGTKAASLQPLRTLGQYRRTEDGVIFGMNGIHETPGRISVGDPVIHRTTE